MPRRLFFRLLAAAAPPGDHVPDAELLRRFASAKDPAAFELLVRRHADAVWAAGLRVAGDRADAEDVFQTAFLVLARRAGAVRGPCAGGFLHRVAVNAALKLKARRARATAADLSAVPSAAPNPSDRDEAAVVHEELARLPDRYRLPVVLCDLEGQTHAEAAKVLGWPVGSVSGRLSRARGLLRDRLTRRGLAAPAALLTAATAPMPVVTAAASGAVVASPVVLSLAEGVLSAMRTAKLQLVAVVLTAGGFIALGAGYALTRVPAQVPAAAAELAAEKQPPAPKAENWTPTGPEPVASAFPDLKLPSQATRDEAREYWNNIKKLYPRVLGDNVIEAEAGDDVARKLLKARLHQGRLQVAGMMQTIGIGRFDSTFLDAHLECLADMRAVATELWAADPKTLIPWLEEFVVIGKDIERILRARVDAQIDPPHVTTVGSRHRLAAESALWKAKNPPKR